VQARRFTATKTSLPRTSLQAMRACERGEFNRIVRVGSAVGIRRTASGRHHRGTGQSGTGVTGSTVFIACLAGMKLRVTAGRANGIAPGAIRAMPGHLGEGGLPACGCPPRKGNRFEAA